MDEKEALKRAAGLCSMKEHSTGSIREKLKAWDIGHEAAERILQKLRNEKFLDDRRYARAYVRDKFTLNSWGKIKISHMLRTKGIEGEVITEALEEIDQSTYEEACTRLIREKSVMLKEKNLFSRKAKLFRFASGRGFEPDLIYRILDKL